VRKYVDGESLSESLIRSGLGVIYHGKTKSNNWCEERMDTTYNVENISYLGIDND